MPKKRGKKAPAKKAKARKQRQKLKERREREREKERKKNKKHMTAEILREKEERKILILREKEKRKILKLREKEEIKKREKIRESKQEISRQFYRISTEFLYGLKIGDKIPIAGREGKLVLMRGNGEVVISFRKAHKKNRVPYLNWSFCTCIIDKYNDDNKLLNNMCDFHPSHSYSPCDCDCGSTNILAVMIYQNNYFGRTGENWNPQEWPFSCNNNYNTPVCTCKYCEKQKTFGSPKEMKQLLSSCCQTQKTIFYDIFKCGLYKLPVELNHYILSYLPACKYECGWFESSIHHYNMNVYRPYRKNHRIYNLKIEYSSSNSSEDEEAQTHVRYYAIY
jgi:hypothetical protein